jgi:hypothetical protein
MYLCLISIIFLKFPSSNASAFKSIIHNYYTLFIPVYFFIYFHATPLYPQKLALNSPTSGGRSVGIVRSQTKAMELVS